MNSKYHIDRNYLTYQSEKDLWSVLYAVSSLYSIGYSLVRPTPGNWSNALISVTDRINNVMSAVSRLTFAIADIQRAIAELPPMMNGIIEANLVETELNKAKVRCKLLKAFFKNDSALEANIDDVMRLGMENLVALGLFDEWYETNSSGKVSYITTMAPILVPTMFAINYSQVKKWEIANKGKNYDNYPFDEILNHTDFYTHDKLTEAYREIVGETKSTAETYALDSERVFPFSNIDEADGVLSDEELIDSSKQISTYRFVNDDFHYFNRIISGDLPPNPIYDDLYFGGWFVSSNDDYVIAPISTFRYSDGAYSQDARFTRSNLVPPSDPVKLQRAKSQAHIIATAKWRMDRIRIIQEHIEGHERICNDLIAGSVWNQD